MTVPKTNNYMQVLILAAEITAGSSYSFSFKGQPAGFKTKIASQSHSAAC